MISKARKQVKILGIKVDITSKERVLRFVRANLSASSRNKKKFLIVTPNPEQVILAQDDEVFEKVLNGADISIPDGIGLIAAHKFLALPTTDSYLLRPFLYFAQGLGVGFSVLFDRKWLTSEISLIRGRETFLELIKVANKAGWRIFLLGGWDKVAQRTKMALEKNYKRVSIGAATGPVLKSDGTPISKQEKEIEEKVVDLINKFEPHILFVGFRAPVQEKWVARWINRLNIGGAMVVGGTFNYISGKSKLPPKWVADTGLEWLWRLLTGSQRIERVASVFPAFPLRVFLNKLGS